MHMHKKSEKNPSRSQSHMDECDIRYKKLNLVRSERARVRREERTREQEKKAALQRKEREAKYRAMVAKNPSRYTLMTFTCEVCGCRGYFVKEINNAMAAKYCSDVCSYRARYSRNSKNGRPHNEKVEQKTLLITRWRGGTNGVSVHEMRNTDVEQYLLGYNVENRDVTLRYRNPELWSKLETKASKSTLRRFKVKSGHVRKQSFDDAAIGQLKQRALDDMDGDI